MSRGLRRAAVIALGGMAVLLVAAAPALTLGEWLDRYHALRTVPLETAQTMPEFRVLVGAVGDAAVDYRQDVEDGRAGRKKLRACPPAEVDMSPDDFTAALEKLPRTMRKRSLPYAVGVILDARYPCPAKPRKAAGRTAIPSTPARATAA